ncbi:MAG: hypothetical protein IT372_09280 [Polyangiaceae bacterium]|nr:hypothetical protein [Polyangiaceae bacterium]
MADRFIDQDETQIYGPYAVKRIRAKVVGLVPEFNDGMTYLADRIDAATQAVKAAIDAPRQTGKTTALLTLAAELTAEGRYAAALVSAEQGAPFGDDPDAAEGGRARLLPDRDLGAAPPGPPAAAVAGGRAGASPPGRAGGVGDRLPAPDRALHRRDRRPPR